MHNVTVNKDYRVTIPKEVRERLGLQPGQKLVVIVRGKTISLVPAPKLEELRGSRAYVDMVTGLIAEGIASIGAEAIIEFGEKDRDIFTQATISLMESRLAGSAGAEPQLEFRCVGSSISSGVIIRSKDGRVIIDNSFSNRLRRLKEELRGEVAEMLLG